MPNIFDQKFQYELILDHNLFEEVRQYCEKNIGHRTHWMSSRVGGKQWYMAMWYSRPKFTVGLDDPGHATILALKYGGKI